jgi:hypothetical protein
MNYQFIIDAILFWTGVFSLSYLIPFLIKKGWEDGYNASLQKRKVCDVCFRDISKFNDYCKKKGL